MEHVLHTEPFNHSGILGGPRAFGKKKQIYVFLQREDIYTYIRVCVCIVCMYGRACICIIVRTFLLGVFVQIVLKSLAP